MRWTIRVNYSSHPTSGAARMVARCRGRQKTIPYRCDLNSDARRFDAAIQLRDKIQLREECYMQFLRETEKGFEFEIWNLTVRPPADYCRFCETAHYATREFKTGDCDARWNDIHWRWDMPSAADRRVERAATSDNPMMQEVLDAAEGDTDNPMVSEYKDAGGAE